MARKHVKPHAVLSSTEEEDIAFGKNRAKGWMKGKPRGGGSSRLEIKKKKKRGGTVSRKRGGKIMQGYKAGGKV